MVRDDPDITGLLEAWSGGELSALDRLLPLVFNDLHRMARRFFHRESATHTLQPTALISEVYLRLRGQKKLHFENRNDFFNFAADVMRHFLVDYARRRAADKRGGGATAVALDSGVTVGPIATKLSSTQLLDIDHALERLEGMAPQQAHIVKLRFFLGLKVSEISELLGISESTVKREWRTAKYWLRRSLGETFDLD